MYLNKRKYYGDCQNINLKDLKTDYMNLNNENNLKKFDNTLILNYGSFYTKAGYNNTPEPMLICPSVSIRIKRANEDLILSGNLVSPHNMKNSCKNIFELSTFQKYDKNDRFKKNNIINTKLMDTQVLEDFNDYIFNHLKLNKVPNKCIIFTELLGANKLRKNFLELFFEAYSFDYVLPVCDIFVSLYSDIFSKIKDDIFSINYYKDKSNYIIDDAKIFFNNNLTVDTNLTCLLIHIGNLKINIVPVLNGRILYKYIKRINMGINQCKSYLKTFLGLKYPQLKNKLTNHNITLLTENLCYVSLDFNNQLKFLKDGVEILVEKKNIPNYINKNKLKLNYEKPIFIQFFESEYEKLKFNEEKIATKLKRQKQAKKMSEMMKQKKEEKKKENILKLEKYNYILKLSDLNTKTFKEELELINIQSKEVLLKLIKNLKFKLGYLNEEEFNKDRFDLLDKDDSELTKEDLLRKRIQVMQKIKHENTLIRKEKKLKKQMKIDELKKEDPEKYYNNLLSKRNSLKLKINKIKTYKEDKSFNNYREKRLNYLNELYMENKITKEEFDNDDIVANYENSSDCEKYQNKIFELDNEIRVVNPNFEDEEINFNNFFANCDLIDFGVEACKTFEILFKPYILGCNQMGISELANKVIQSFPINIQKGFLNNILIKGGGSQIKGISERIEADIRRELLFNNPKINIHKSKDPLNENYKNLVEISKNDWKKFAISKKDYESYGETYYNNFILSNM